MKFSSKQIVGHLYVVGLRPADIAAELKVSRQAVSAVITGKEASRRIALRISQATGIPVSKLWPGRYDKRLRQAA